MASNSDNADNNNLRPLLLPEIGPDGLPGESSVISYTEKDGNPVVDVQSATTSVAASVPTTLESSCGSPGNVSNLGNVGNVPVVNGINQQSQVDGEGRKKKNLIQGRGKGIGAMPKGRGSTGPGWTGAGFDVDGRN